MLTSLDGWTLCRATDLNLSESAPLWSDSLDCLHVSLNPDGAFLLASAPSFAQISFAGAEICLWSDPPDLPSETLDHFLADQVLPRIRAHQGDFVLHAGAVVLGDQALAFLGPSGRGKSTLTASFQKHGAALLGDDALVVAMGGDGPSVRAVYASLRLLPDSLAHLFPEPPPTRDVAHYSDKQSLPVVESGSAPLAALCFLGEDSDDIALRRMSVAETCIGLIANSFSLDPTDPAHARQKLANASALAAALPAWEISYPRDYMRLSEVHAAIRALIPKQPT